jgi:hypothetical protein
MDREELELFRASLQKATTNCTGKALDDALDELGWRDALVADRRAAVSTLFELQGRANASSSALDIVMANALGVDAPVVLPPLRSCDQPRNLVEVTGDFQLAGPSSAWPIAVAAGQRALAHELIGASRAMLQLAREHTVERVQFGRPIAAFQAVRHRLAESLVAIEAADAALDAAWTFESPMNAMLGKAIAGRNARIVARHCQQVLAGIGFTTEHPFHRYLRRTLVLDGLLGDARTLTKELGDELLRTRQLPPVLPL